jgi:glyoxylase-like metal-dependent hydrolase (beta-lactamase superfamily II)
MKIFPVIAENWKVDGGVAFGVVPKGIWSKLMEPDENNMVKITTRCLLVEDENRLILFDVGMGRKQNEKFYGFRYLFGDDDLQNNLSELGYTFDDITDIVFTHLHDDHCGAATKLNDDNKTELVFKNASFHVSKEQWDWANNPNKREIGSFFQLNLKPLADTGRLNFIEKAGYFTKNIELRMVHGHTQGQLIPLLSFKGQTFVFMGDFIPAAVNIPLPFIPSVDVQPLLTLKEKASFLNEAADKDYYLIFEHDYDIECCTVMQTEKGVRLNKTYRLNEILN